MEWIGKIIEAAKLPTKFIVVIFLVSFALLFLSEEKLTSLKLVDFVKKFGLYIGITTLTSAALLAIESISYIWNRVTDSISSRKFKKSSLERLNKLDPSEKSVLREFYLQGQNSLKLPMDHPVVAGLINVGIIRLIGQHGRMSAAGMLFSMKISDFVRENLTYDLLDLPSGEPSHQEIEFLKSNRPPFMNSILREESLFNGW
ncbi:superinfection exclusion B family protein [Aeromonas dhakensis]|uniref:superinfection exclusion B family protein n=1 Tax=Aeromonas dhakensis TaxID=196024 RepID=UPI000F51E4E6|nr:superinfection exclusion B family protein [Aeromonas dhakensis]RQM79687.1 hypothetical protein EHZ77_20060 [Aeromonas dhakensis]